MTDHVNGREVVLDMLLEVLEGDKYSHTVLNQHLKKHQLLEKQERAFITRLFTDTVKRYLTLDYIIEQFSTLPVRKMKPLIRNLLRMSIYQIMYMDQIPESAVCNEAVKLAKKRGFSKLSGFVNGILRNIIREKDGLTFPDRSKNEVEYLKIMYSTPEWLVKQLLEQYDDATAEAVLKASLRERETSIRCNRAKVSPDQLKENLIEEGVIVERSEYLDYAYVIHNYDYLDKLQSFRQGEFTVQDVSSMLVCEVAEIKESDFVIDVCSAPGGKSLQAAEKARRVSARDLTEYKINLINENCNRMGFTNVETLVWDATVTDESMINSADVVIADLPCSGLGVIGKKSDIKYRMSHEQQKELVELQRKILSAVQQYVKKGGVLVYSTCTINKDENEENRNWFLENYDFETESIDPYLPKQLQGETTQKGYLQLLQGVHNSDGFFIAKFRRK